MLFLRFIILFTGLCLLGGCDYIVYKPDIVQGNILSEETVAKVEPGMTKEQVQFILGPPMLVDTFHQNQWDYIYDAKPNRGEPSRYQVVVFFKDDVVEEVRKYTPLPEKTIE